MRVFKFEGEYGNDHLELFDESEISTDYQMTGFWFKNESFDSNLADYQSELSVEVEAYKLDNPDWTEADIEELINEFDESYCYDSDSSPMGQYGRPTEWLQESDEDYVTDIEKYYDEPNGDQADPIGYEFHSNWDGSNWRKTYLSDEVNPMVCEVTDEYGDSDFWVEFGGFKGRYGGGHWLFDPVTETIFCYNWSAWQGTTPSWKVQDEKSMLVAMLQKHVEISDTDGRLNEILAGYLQSAIDSVPLNRGEKIEFDGETFVLTYRGHDYHFSFNEMVEYWEDEICFEIPIEMARDQIRKRRVEMIMDRLAANNYELVLKLPLDTIMVSFSNSIDAGNCEEYTLRLMDEIREKEGIKEKRFKFPANRLLEYRDDAYSRRAILNAYRMT